MSDDSSERILTAIAALAVSVTDILASQTRLQEGQTRLEEGHASFEAIVLTRLDRLEERLDRFEERFDRLEERFDRLEARFERLEARFERLEASHTRLRVDVMERIDRLQNLVTVIRDDIGVNMGRADRAHQAADSTRAELRALGEQVNAMARQIAHLQTQVREIRGDP